MILPRPKEPICDPITAETAPTAKRAGPGRNPAKKAARLRFLRPLYPQMQLRQLSRRHWRRCPHQQVTRHLVERGRQ